MHLKNLAGKKDFACYLKRTGKYRELFSFAYFLCFCT